MYYKVENYTNDDGMIISAKVYCASNKQEEGLLALNPQTDYVGTVPIRAMTPQGPMQFPFEFEFPQGMTISQCFEKFEEIAKTAIEEEKQKQQDRNRIIPATNIPPNLTVLPK
jgi:hypothetical protein